MGYKNLVEYKVDKQKHKPISSNKEIDFPSQEEVNRNADSKKN